MIKKNPTHTHMISNKMITMINHTGNFFFPGAAAGGIGTGPAGT
jgi:hypothetical protein